MMLPAMFSQKPYPGNSSSKAIREEPQTTCPDCKQQISVNARFCPVCGHQQILLARCDNCGKNLTPKARFCSQCGMKTHKSKIPQICNKCKAENLADSIFCNQCGQRFDQS